MHFWSPFSAFLFYHKQSQYVSELDNIDIINPKGLVESPGATIDGTYAVPLTLNKPTMPPPIADEIIAVANTNLLENIKGYADSTKVPNPIFIKNPGTAIDLSSFLIGKRILAKLIPAEHITNPTISIEPKKLEPVDSISNKTIGKIAA